MMTGELAKMGCSLIVIRATARSYQPQPLGPHRPRVAPRECDLKSLSIARASWLMALFGGSTGGIGTISTSVAGAFLPFFFLVAFFFLSAFFLFLSAFFLA